MMEQGKDKSVFNYNSGLVDWLAGDRIGSCYFADPYCNGYTLHVWRDVFYGGEAKLVISDGPYRYQLRFTVASDAYGHPTPWSIETRMSFDKDPECGALVGIESAFCDFHENLATPFEKVVCRFWEASYDIGTVNAGDYCSGGVCCAPCPNAKGQGDSEY